MSPPVAVVTGANRGIGRAIAVAFAAAGYAVLASARDPASLADTLAEQKSDYLKLIMMNKKNKTNKNKSNKKKK